MTSSIDLFFELLDGFPLISILDNTETSFRGWLEQGGPTPVTEELMRLAREPVPMTSLKMSYPVARNGLLPDVTVDYQIESITGMEILKQMAAFYDQSLTRKEMARHREVDPQVDLNEKYGQPTRYDALIGSDFAQTWCRKIIKIDDCYYIMLTTDD